jgi:hypothetical protein
MSTYVIAPTGADIMHYGKGHDDNPPGRGSGTWIPIMKPDLNNKPAQKAIDELRSTYKYKLE